MVLWIETDFHLEKATMGIKVNIIGAGVSGLAVGCYLQMNGFDTEIFEMHNQPGGLCTAWKRKGVRLWSGRNTFAYVRGEVRLSRSSQIPAGCKRRCCA